MKHYVDSHLNVVNYSECVCVILRCCCFQSKGSLSMIVCSFLSRLSCIHQHMCCHPTSCICIFLLLSWFLILVGLRKIPRFRKMYRRLVQPWQVTNRVNHRSDPWRPHEMESNPRLSWSDTDNTYGFSWFTDWDRMSIIQQHVRNNTCISYDFKVGQLQTQVMLIWIIDPSNWKYSKRTHRIIWTNANATRSCHNVRSKKKKSAPLSICTDRICSEHWTFPEEITWICKFTLIDNSFHAVMSDSFIMTKDQGNPMVWDIIVTWW